MPTLVDIPDIGEVEFPDEMDDAAIQAAIEGEIIPEQKRQVKGVALRKELKKQQASPRLAEKALYTLGTLAEGGTFKGIGESLSTAFRAPHTLSKELGTIPEDAEMGESLITPEAIETIRQNPILRQTILGSPGIPETLRAFAAPESIVALGPLAPLKFTRIPAATKPLIGAFGVQAFGHAGDQAAELGRLTVEGTPNEQASAWQQALVTAGMIAAPIALPTKQAPLSPEFASLPDPALVAANLAAPGTIRPQEIRGGVPAQFERPPEMVIIPPEAFNPPPNRIWEGVRIEDAPLETPLPPKVQRETRGKVSFGAEAPTLLRNVQEQPGVPNAIPKQETRTVHEDVRTQPAEGAAAVPVEASAAGVPRGEGTPAQQAAPGVQLTEAPEVVDPAILTRELQSEPGFVYHATNSERLGEIAESGKLQTHKPDYGTDQTVWPDGSKDKRSYFSGKADVVWQFAPEEGTPVVIRLSEAPDLKREATGDIYSTKPIPISRLQYLGKDGTWHPVSNLSKKPTTTPAVEPAKPVETAAKVEEAALGPGTGAGPGSPSGTEFTAQRSEPVAVAQPPRKTIAERVRAAVDRLFSKPQGEDSPIQTRTDTPLPNFQPHRNAKRIFSQPFGFERIPVLGALWGGMRRIAGQVHESIVTLHAERQVGRAIASALRQQYSWLDQPFTIEKGQITNIGRTQDGQSLFISDVFEALQRDPDAYVLSVSQRQAFEAIQQLEADFKTLERQNGIGNVVDGESPVDSGMVGPDESLNVYFPRVVVSRANAQPITRGQGVGGKMFFEKSRMFNTEAEGWQRGNVYETSIASRISTRAERLYKKIADKRFMDDPDLGAITRRELDAQLREAYADELADGTMTDSKLSKIGDSIATSGRVYQPALFGKIFPRETADIINKAFPNSSSLVRQTAANVNNALKGLWLGFDLGVQFIQGQGVLAYNAPIWARATLNSLRAFADQRFFPEYVRRNLGPIREMAQMGSSVGRMEEMLAGTERGELLHQVPIIKQTVGQAIKPFARQFQTFLDTAKVELWKSMREVVPPEQHMRTMQSIESLLSTARMEPIGVGASRALTERVLFIAPSYYRGALNHIASLGEKGVSGAIARRAIGSYLAGGALLYYGIAKGLGMSDEDIARRLDPRRSDFMMWRVKLKNRNLEIGLGGIFKSLLRLGGNIVRTSVENPGNWASLSPEKNPFTRWYRSHSGPVVGLAWDQFTGKDFMGRDRDISDLSTHGLPMTARTALDPNQAFSPGETAATFVGLSAFSRGNEAVQEISRLSGQFLKDQGRERPKLEFPDNENTYYGLRHAIRSGQDKKAKEIIAELRKTKTVRQIIDSMESSATRPFTGSKKLEISFRRKLTPEQQKLYRQAQKERLKELSQFRRLLR